jgi:hypothetical protein
MGISSGENQRKINIIKNKLDKDLLSNEQIQEYYKTDEIVIIRDDVDIPSDDIFKEVKKNYLNKTGKIVHTMLHDGLVRVHIPKKRYDLYWNYKDCIPVKLLDEIPEEQYKPTYNSKDNEKVLENNSRVNFRKIAIITENKEKSDIVQNLLFDNGYEWKTYRSERVIKNFSEYPTVLFAYIDNMQITMMEMDLSESYYIDNLEKLKNGTYNDTYYRLFDMSSLGKYTNMIKYKKETPSYSPRKIKRTLESRNSIEEAEEICIKIDNKEDLHKFEKLIIPYKIGFEISDELNQSKIDNISIEKPIWMFIRFDDYYTTHLSYDEFISDGAQPGDIKNYMCNGVWERVLDIDNDLPLIQRILRQQKIDIIPTYSPKRIERTLESRNSAEEAAEICIKMVKPEDLYKLDKMIKLYKNNFDITYEISEITIDKITEENPIWIFIDLKIYSISHLDLNDWKFEECEPGDMTAQTCDGVWGKMLDMNNDFYIIKKILEQQKIPILPTYKPKRIERTLEMNNLKKYNDFLFDSILEDISSGELSLVFSQRLRDILKEIDHPISERLINSELEEDDKYNITLIDISDDNDKFTVASSNKISDLLSNQIEEFDNREFLYFITELENSSIWDKFRNVIKIGKLIKKLFPDEFEDNGLPGEDIESFVNLYKTNFTEDDTKELFDIVKGKDIIHWYKLDNYGLGKSGSILRNSCMAEGCDDYIKFYAINPKKVSMLILYEDVEKERIVGRALLWNIDEINGKEDKRVFMDRIYTIHEYQINYFIKYAKEHDYLYKETQSADEQNIIDPTTDKENLNLNVYGINPTRYYPYLDTIQYYFHDKKMLTNNNIGDTNHESLYLQDTGGDVFNGLYSEKYKRWVADDDKNYVICDLSTFDLHNPERIRKKEDAVYLPYYEEWIPKERYESRVIQIDIGGDYDILKKDAVYLKYYGGWTSKDYIQSTYNRSEYYDDYLKDDDSVLSVKLDDYLIKDKSIKVYNDITKTSFDYLPDNSDELKDLAYSVKGDYIFKK